MKKDSIWVNKGFILNKFKIMGYKCNEKELIIRRIQSLCDQLTSSYWLVTKKLPLKRKLHHNTPPTNATLNT